MPKKHAIDADLVESIAGNLFDALPVFPKRMLRLDQIQHKHHMPLSHIQILAMLGGGGELSIGELSRQLAIAKPNIGVPHAGRARPPHRECGHHPGGTEADGGNPRNHLRADWRMGGAAQPQRTQGAE